MKKNYTKNANRFFAAVITAAMAAAMLTGCSKTAAEPAKTEPEVVEEESNIVSPYVADLEKYDSVISGLNDKQYFAFAAASPDQDLLLVTEGVYEYDENTKGAIDATVYCVDGDGNVKEIGTIFSEGTAYPIAVYGDGYLMYGGNHHMAMTYVDNGNMITKKDASELFDTDGNATYYLFDLDGKFEGEVEDNSQLLEMFDEYSQAIPLNFTQAQ